MIKCPKCGGKLHKTAVLTLNAGARRSLCPTCRFWVRMRPKMYLLISMVPVTLVALMALLIAVQMFLVFVVGAILIRVLWFFIAPYVVPLEPVSRQP